MRQINPALLGVACLFAFAAAPTSAQTVLPESVPVSDSMLAETRGMTDVRVVEQTTTVTSNSTVEGNTINGNFTTGLINLGDGALNNFNGLGLFNINTGNNVAINSAMTVNVAIQP